MPDRKVPREMSNEILEEMRTFLSLPEDEISPRMVQRIQMGLETIQSSPDILFSYGVETAPEEYERTMNIVRAVSSRLRNQFGYRPRNKIATGETTSGPNSPTYYGPIQQQFGQRLTAGILPEEEVQYINDIRRKQGAPPLNPNMWHTPNPNRP